MRKLLLFICLLAFGTAAVQAQTPTNDDLIQFSGIVVGGDSLSPVPFTTIIIEGTYRGTVTDYYGFFSFVAAKNDTINFSHVGMEDSQFIIPDTLSTNRYSLIQVMNKDTVYLREAFVYPWPSKEQFKEAFLALDLHDDDYLRANRNLARDRMREIAENTPMDASENYKVAMNQYQSRLYYAGGTPPINILNPLAWAQFVEAWKRGDFKSKKKQ